MTARKYKKGIKIKSFNQLLDELNRVGFCYIRHKIYHRGWIYGMQFRTLDYDMIAGDMWTAEKIEHEATNHE